MKQSCRKFKKKGKRKEVKLLKDHYIVVCPTDLEQLEKEDLNVIHFMYYKTLNNAIEARKIILTEYKILAKIVEVSFEFKEIV